MESEKLVVKYLYLISHRTLTNTAATSSNYNLINDQPRTGQDLLND